jgi:hypothetical protein
MNGLFEEAQEALLQVRRELDLPATLLVGDQPQTFGETDRLRSEGELRLALVPPLLALTCVLAVTNSPLWLLAVPGIAVLLWQGVQREDEARRVIASAISFGRKVPSQSRDAFARYVGELEDRVPEGASYDERLQKQLSEIRIEEDRLRTAQSLARERARLSSKGSVFDRSDDD